METVNLILLFLGGLGSFLIGFKLISSNVEKLAGKYLKRLFQKVNKNKMVGVGIGAVTTAAVQSSSATTVMVVGFVNAGLMTLLQATPIIMGANIGTTITALLMSIGGTNGSFSLSIVFISLTAVGGFMNLLGGKHEKVKGWGMAVAGFGLMFLGMNICKENMTSLITSNETIATFIGSVSNPILLIVLGLVLTAIVQSSAAVTVLVMTLSAALAASGSGTGLVGDSVLFLILGTNIGTCVTALLSSIGTNANARRASIIHLLFNVLGAILFTLILTILNANNIYLYQNLLYVWMGENSELAIAIFHFAFNIICALLFLPFSSLFVKASTIIIKDKNNEKEQSFLDARFISNGSIALSQVKKEMLRMGDIYMDALRRSFDAFLKLDDNESIEVHELIKRGTEINQDIVKYIVKIPSDALNEELDFKVQATYHDLADLDRIGEIADNLTKHTHKSVSEDLTFSDTVKVDLEKMMTKIEEQYQSMKMYLIYKDPQYFIKTEDDEEIIDNMRSELVQSHLDRLQEGKCNPNSSGVFINLVGNLERVGDHINFVSERYHTTRKD
jgi:phosphate:Na+ symporter